MPKLYKELISMSLTSISKNLHTVHDAKSVSKSSINELISLMMISISCRIADGVKMPNKHQKPTVTANCNE